MLCLFTIQMRQESWGQMLILHIGEELLVVGMGRAGRCLSYSENMLFLQTTQAEFLAPTLGSSQLPATSAPGDPMSFSGLYRQLHSCDTHIYIPTGTHTNKKTHIFKRLLVV